MPVGSISCERKCKFDGRKFNSNQKWNNNKCQWNCKNPEEHHVYKTNAIIFGVHMSSLVHIDNEGT